VPAAARHAGTAPLPTAQTHRDTLKRGCGQRIWEEIDHLDWIKAEFVKCADDKHDRKQRARKAMSSAPNILPLKAGF
jgi:hypothetical protein